MKTVPIQKADVAESEAMSKERKMKTWNKPIIRHIGQTVYTRTGTNDDG